MNKLSNEVNATTALIAEQDDIQEIEGILTLLQELMDSVRKEVKHDCLEEAISRLRDALENGSISGKDRLMVYSDLTCALLMRYGLYGWIDDLDSCSKHSNEVFGSVNVIESLHQDSESNAAFTVIYDVAPLIYRCRTSISIALLSTIICTATEALATYASSHLDDKLIPHIANLRFLLGQALVMKYLGIRNASALDQATQSFQEAGLICRKDASLEYVSLTWLTHIEWLQMTEYGDFEAFTRICSYQEKAGALDEKGRSLSDLGNALIQDPTDEAKVREGIALLTASLQYRTVAHPRRCDTSTALALAHFNRFERLGNRADLEECIALYQEALDLQQSSHSVRSGWLNNLANSLHSRFNIDHKDFKDLEESIALHRKALALHPLPHPGRFPSLHNLADALDTLFEHKKEFSNLQECISLRRQALDVLPSPHFHRSMALNSLADALLTRFKQEGSLHDLEECIAHAREGLDLRRPPHPDRVSSLHSLSNALRTRFENKCAFRDLEECISLKREALELKPPHHPEYCVYLEGLAAALLARFSHSGTLQDLEEGITLYREGLCRQPPPNQSVSVILTNLAIALLIRFEHKGTFHDLEESVTLHRKALDLQPSPHSERPLTLSNLANTLLARFEHSHVFQDLEECIALNQEAICLQLPPHLPRHKLLGNLANAHLSRFWNKRVLQDIEQCINLHREALSLLPSSHPDRIRSLTNLANAVITRVEDGLAAPHDIEEGISLYQEVLDLRPPPHPNRCMSLSSLALAFFIRFEQKEGSEEDLQKAMGYFKEAVKYPTGSLIGRLKFSKSWAAGSQKHGHPSTLDAFVCSMEILPQLASLDLTLEQRQDVLQHSRELVGNAAKCAIDACQCELAVTFLSTGRSIFWSQALQLRTPVDRLLISHSAVAEKFVSISRQLEIASYSGRTPTSGLTAAESLDTSIGTHPGLHMLLNQREQTINEIRRIPGYESFLLPPSFSTLQLAAKNGPVILLNASALGCDAVILRGTEPLQHVPLSGIRFDDLCFLKELIYNLSGSGIRSAEIHPDVVDTLQQLLGRDMAPRSSSDLQEDAFRWVLEWLWFKVVLPVVLALGITKTDSPHRIWWCPTGPFSSLPVHAAGIYSVENEPIDCLFEYAISSYCTSPQDLLHPPPQVAQTYQMTAIIEPEVPKAAPLPATLIELETMLGHIPDRQHLITRVGSGNTPNQVEDLVSDIQQSSFVHFGCHGLQNLKDPLESYLLLSGGKLTMSTIIKQCQVPEGALAYLSACETAKGDEERPDESLNLVATMMFAGFRSVVGTLWSIMDDDAPIVADVFYRHLFRNGKDSPPDVRDAAYGLHLATKELRDQGKSFYSWVPYVHYGI